MGADDFEVCSGVHAHFDLVVGAGEELGEGGAEGDFSACAHAGTDGDHVLFSDFTFDEAIGVGFVFGEGL